jgi:hypothetical protein
MKIGMARKSQDRKKKPNCACVALTERDGERPKTKWIYRKKKAELETQSGLHELICCRKETIFTRRHKQDEESDDD